MKNEIKEIEVNGNKYILKSEADKIKQIESEHVIVIAQRGWIFEGYKNKKITDKIILNNANVVRKWTNGRGIGGLTKQQYKDEYILDYAGTVELANEGIITIINCEW